MHIICAQVNTITFTDLSICGDGTGIKNQQHDARFIRMDLHTSNHNPSDATDQPHNRSEAPPLRTLGVHKSRNHMAQSQLDGWTTLVESCCQLLKRAPLGHDTEVNSRIFGTKLRGILTDHASDQKLLVKLLHSWKVRCDRELRGEALLAKMPADEQLRALSGHLEAACSSVGSWDSLSPDQQGQIMHDAWSALTLAMGDQAFQELTSDEQQATDLLLWTGCCMHKELNAVKGGVTSMAAVWSKLGLAPPIQLKNKFESAQSATVDSQANPRKQEGDRGAVKLTSLAGAIFNHKDDKRGQQDTYRYFFEVYLPI